jgi:hypothetical protein
MGAHPQAHRNHRRIDKTMLPEKRLRHIFGPIGQQRDSEKVFLLRKIDCVFEKPVAVAVTLILRVHHQVLQEHDEPAFRRADGEEQIDHPNDGAIAAQHKDPATAGLFENEPQPAELFVFIGTEVALLSEQIAEHFRQLVQVGFRRRLDHDIFFVRHILASRYFKNPPCWQLRKLDLRPDSDNVVIVRNWSRLNIVVARCR